MKKITLRLIIILSLLLLVSCNSQTRVFKQLEKLEKNHPELFKEDTTYIIEVDSITFIVPEYKVDTFLLTQDTIQIEDTQVHIEIIKSNDTTYVYALCKPDTIIHTQIDTTSIIKDKTITKIVKEKYIPLYAKIIIFLWLLIVLNLIVRIYFHIKNKS